MSVLLSIKPEFAEKIFSGEKRFEFRRVMPTQAVERVIVYASSPVCRLIGEFKVRRVVTASPAELWRLTRLYAGISKSYFDVYFTGRDQAHAFEVETSLRYEMPIDPRRVLRTFRAPQSFVYLSSMHGFEQRLRAAA
jgi:predicted transcriptional regulator